MNGKELTTRHLFNAYSQGWFPMSVDEATNVVEWYQPYDRCLFPISGMRVSRSLRKTLRSRTFEVTFDQAFEDVIRSCRRPTDNWISEDFIRVYTEAHREGWAHSCEVWHQGSLVGGTYGLAIGGAFFAESMFHRITDASKVALYHVVETCRSAGFVLFDAQIMNPHLKSLGAFTIPAEQYEVELRKALSVKTSRFS